MLWFPKKNAVKKRHEVGLIGYCATCKYYEKTEVGYICTNPDSDNCAIKVVPIDWCNEWEAL